MFKKGRNFSVPFFNCRLILISKYIHRYVKKKEIHLLPEQQLFIMVTLAVRSVCGLSTRNSLALALDTVTALIKTPSANP